jgi:hypothetical protein
MGSETTGRLWERPQSSPRGLKIII